MISFIKKIFTLILYPLNGKKGSKVAVSNAAEAKPVKGTEGLLDAPASFVRHNGRTILVVTKDLGDMPSWVEYDIDLRQFSIVQSGGSVAYLTLFLQDEDQTAVKEDNRILLVTKVQEQQIMHHLQFVVR